MTASTVAAIAGAVTAVAGSITSVLVLATRIGRLTGSMEERLKAGADDRRNIRRDLNVLTSRFNRHAESPHN